MQVIASYQEKNYLSLITEKIKRDAERKKMYVKTVSLSSCIKGDTIFYHAIVVFEKEEV